MLAGNFQSKQLRQQWNETVEGRQKRAEFINNFFLFSLIFLSLYTANSPYVFLRIQLRASKQKVWIEAENGERDCLASVTLKAGFHWRVFGYAR